MRVARARRGFKLQHKGVAQAKQLFRKVRHLELPPAGSFELLIFGYYPIPVNGTHNPCGSIHSHERELLGRTCKKRKSGCYDSNVSTPFNFFCKLANKCETNRVSVIHPLIDIHDRILPNMPLHACKNSQSSPYFPLFKEL